MALGKLIDGCIKDSKPLLEKVFEIFITYIYVSTTIYIYAYSWKSLTKVVSSGMYIVNLCEFLYAASPSQFNENL